MNKSYATMCKCRYTRAEAAVILRGMRRCAFKSYARPYISAIAIERTSKRHTYRSVQTGIVLRVVAA